MASLVSLLTQVFSPSAAPATVSVRTVSSNPYNNNPFMNYNGKQNIVGQRLFIEV